MERKRIGYAELQKTNGPWIIFNPIMDRFEYWKGGVRIYVTADVRTLEGD